MKKLLLAAALIAEDVDVARAVHRLDAELARLDLGEIHVVAVGLPVAGALGREARAQPDNADRSHSI